MKENHEYSKMIAKYFACRHPRPWGWVTRSKLNILPAADPPIPLPHPPDPWQMGSIGQKSTFSDHGDVADKLKGIMNSAT